LANVYGFCPTRTKGQVEIALDCVDRFERIRDVPQACGFPAATTAAVGLNAHLDPSEFLAGDGKPASVFDAS